MPISAPIVTTPVPPTPVITTLHGALSDGSAGGGRFLGSAAFALLGLRNAPPSTVTKLGQNPLTHE